MEVAQGFNVRYLEEYLARSPLMNTHKLLHGRSHQHSSREVGQRYHASLLKLPEPATKDEYGKQFFLGHKC